MNPWELVSLAFCAIGVVLIGSAMFDLLVDKLKRRIYSEQGPTEYLVSYLDMKGSTSTYGHCTVTVKKGGITPNNLDEVREVARKQCGCPTATILAFSRFESRDSLEKKQ